MRRRFVTLDVFTDRPFAGNALAVVLEAARLDDAAMQAIAREFNLSETVFVLPATDPRHRARLRIFTPAHELPFAGHPTVGTAVLLGQIDGGAEPRTIVLEEGIGPVRCHVEALRDGAQGAGGFARFNLARLPQPVGSQPDSRLVAAALGLDPDDLGFGNFVLAAWSAGNPLTFVPVRGRRAVAQSRPDLGRWDAAFAGAPGKAFVFCAEPVEAKNAFHARMFAPTSGILEDPATGSAAAALAGMIADRAGLGDGDHEFAIEQGHAMGRPSLIMLALTIKGGKLASGSVGGHAVTVSEGSIEA
jgi:trans-2,3-dihydro-3-hydroxyanthranilate isomerase